MKNLFILPCGKKKIWDREPEKGPSLTSQTYIGTFHRLCKSYVEHFGGKWVVISAKHGYLLPDDIINEPYDVSFSEKSENLITIGTLQEQVKQKGLASFPSIIVLTGKKFKPYIEGSFQQYRPVVTFPLEQANGIGTMQKMLKEAVIMNEPLH